MVTEAHKNYCKLGILHQMFRKPKILFPVCILTRENWHIELKSEKFRIIFFCNLKSDLNIED